MPDLQVASDDLDRFDDGGAVVPVDDPEPGPSSPAAPAVMLPAATLEVEADDPHILHVEDVRAARQALIRRLAEARGRTMRKEAA